MKALVRKNHGNSDERDIHHRLLDNHQREGVSKKGLRHRSVLLRFSETHLIDGVSLGGQALLSRNSLTTEDLEERCSLFQIPYFGTLEVIEVQIEKIRVYTVGQRIGA